jgi:ribosomal RNA-processing protein 8
VKPVDIRNYGKTTAQSEYNYSGEVWIAEIKSRFVDQTFQSFVQRLAGMGLKLLDMNKEEKMFVIMRFEKVEVKDDDTGIDEEKLLKACLYKKR